jgi:hypothetical protein
MQKINPFRIWLLLLLICFASHILTAQTTPMVTYAGGGATTIFTDVAQLSNGHFIVSGAAQHLDWIPTNAPKLLLGVSGITNNQGTGRIAFLLELDSTLQQILVAYYLPAGTAEDIQFIKMTQAPGEPTGQIYISGTTTDSNTGGYFIGKLDNNFVLGSPTALTWTMNVKAKNGATPKVYQPWDVDNEGRVVYAYGDSHDFNWSAIYRQKADGTPDVVPNWRVHWATAGGEFYGAAADYPNGGAAGLDYSGIVFKRDGNRCELRSTNADDYDLWQPDGNGGQKKGLWPLDVLYNAPCTPGVPGNTTTGPGYSGYSPSGSFTYGPSAICIDRRTNELYIGFNFKSTLPDGNPDFEPAVMAMTADGNLKWWSRLYHEVQPDGATVNSTPDQYVDGLAIDYANNLLTVNARCHGNNVENLWEGDQIFSNSSAQGFQNRFTGSSGNIHISWLGKLQLDFGALQHSTYVAELAESASGIGDPLTAPNMGNWPNPNDGWPTLNTTYLGKNRTKTTADGSVVVLGQGRRTMTTADAYQRMPLPGGAAKSCWNDFVRVYPAHLGQPLYSSLLVGQWDTLTQAGGDNVSLSGVWKTARGVVVVGQHTGEGNDMPVAAVPTWGESIKNGPTGVIAYLPGSQLLNWNDGPVAAPVSSATQVTTTDFLMYPNPTTDHLNLKVPVAGRAEILNVVGQIVWSKEIPAGASRWLLAIPAGVYSVHVCFSDGSMGVQSLVVQ